MTGIGFRCVLAHYIHLMEEERIALFVDYENLAIGARDALGGMEFDFEPIGNALAERGRGAAACKEVVDDGDPKAGLQHSSGNLDPVLRALCR